MLEVKDIAKNRDSKRQEYEDKYCEIPREYNERLGWMYDKFNVSEAKSQEILNVRNLMVNNLHYYDLNIILYEDPEGAKRPRFRGIGRSNFANAAKSNPGFVHVYTPNAQDDSVYMKRLLNSELDFLENMICTPIIVEYITYQKTPSAFSSTDIFLAEMGLIRPIVKPDWDNCGKKYSDMSNGNIWLDDSFVIEGAVKKYYSILPRVEINIRYLNEIYTKYQYNAVTKRKDYENNNCDVDYLRRK